MKDVVVTVVAGIVLALAFMYLLLSLAFSGWGDRFPTPSPSSAYILVGDPTIQPTATRS